MKDLIENLIWGFLTIVCPVAFVVLPLL